MVPHNLLVDNIGGAVVGDRYGIAETPESDDNTCAIDDVANEANNS